MKRIEKHLQNIEKKIEEKVNSIEHSLINTGRNLERSFENIEDNLVKLENAIEDTVQKLERRLEDTTTILEARGVKKYFRQGKQPVLRAVDGIDFALQKGETLGVVGESGCGKSTAARVAIGLMPITEGEMLLDGKPVRTQNPTQRREIRRRTGIVFQDPYGSMDPRMTVADIIGEPLRAHRIVSNKRDAMLMAIDMLEACGMRPDDLFKYPHQFSGGQRQRICIARALVAGPDVVVCDEAVSALDVSIQAQIINLLCDLREDHNLTYLFISHDLTVVQFIADRVAVMYLGKIVEMAPAKSLFNHPWHPYTQMLLTSVPVFGKKKTASKETAPSTEIVLDENIYSGCRFRSRCPKACEECSHEEPVLTEKTKGHSVACHLQ